MNKPEYIQKIEEKSGDILSRLSLVPITTESGEINETNYYLMYSDSIFIDNKIKWLRRILKTRHGFYLYLQKSDDETKILNIDVYYNPEQINELIIFIKQFIKQNK